MVVWPIRFPAKTASALAQNPNRFRMTGEWYGSIAPRVTEIVPHANTMSSVAVPQARKNTSRISAGARRDPGPVPSDRFKISAEGKPPIDPNRLSQPVICSESPTLNIELELGTLSTCSATMSSHTFILGSCYTAVLQAKDKW
ncbi:hypothetical protein NM688_g4092 [Phlebia brevispora]|uniref:Uncharacterized protein n=1 Tax=Phlebia brevispora TaxID=194682 RepID=A0ACC1T437_9APHY|nr:hypothetical protein NM688_g4092 [Phlebia brevispora]